MLKYILVLLVFVTFIQCKTKDYVTPYNYEGRSLSFGNGGGFTGKVLDFTLMDNGQVFKGVNKEGVVDMIKKVKKDKVNQIFNTYDLLALGEMSVDDPGNMYYYISMNDNGKIKKLTWGGANANESKELRVFHANLMGIVTKMPSKQSGQTQNKIEIK